MADSPLLASLLMGQRQEENPFQAQRKFGRNLIVQGSSTAPLGSGNPLEGLARALQGGLGGVVAGLASRDEENQTQNNISVYSDAYKKALGDPQNKIAPDPQGALDVLKGLKGGGAQQEALIGQLLQGGINTAVANQAAEVGLKAGGYGTPSAGGGGSSPAAGYQGTLAGRESGGNPQAVNPQSGAFGLYQFMPQTAADVRQTNPQLNLPEDHRTWTPDQQNQAEQALRGMNNDRLQKLGIPVTPATLALAHATGADGTAKLLSTPPNTPMEQVVPAQWIQQNPSMQGKTVGQYVSQFQTFNRPQGQGQPQGQPQTGGSVSPMQIPVAQGSQEGNVLRAKADALRAAGQPALALPLYKEADIADGKNADIRANRDVPGTPAGDIAVLQSAIRNPQIAQTPEYAAAHARVGKPQMAQGGQLYFPNMTAYPKPAGGEAAQGGRFQDTPESQFKMAQDFHNQYQQDQAVKNWKTIEPVINTMRAVVGNPGKGSDLDLAAGLATLYAPQGGGNLPRGEMLKHLLNVESLPAEIRTAIAGAISGQGMGPEARQAIMAQAEARAAAHKQQFDAVTQQYQKRGAKYGISPEDFMTGPASSQAPAAPGGLTMDAIDAEIARRRGGK